MKAPTGRQRHGLSSQTSEGRTTDQQVLLSNFPAAIAEALGAEKGEEFEWEIEDKNTFVLRRVVPLPPRKSSIGKKAAE